MAISVLSLPGTDAIRVLNEHRARFSTTGEYPFLIGGSEELDRVKEAADDNAQDPLVIISTSKQVNTTNWIENRRKELKEYGWSAEDALGEWPGEIFEKGSIGLHKEILTGKIKSEVYLGLVRIEAPWQLPATLKFGAWNDCPSPEEHCAFHRQWQEQYGAEITGVSGDIVECLVTRPPKDKAGAITLAWEQYWYCSDIVDQGCGTVANLAATLINSTYWYFWWD